MEVNAVDADASYFAGPEKADESHVDGQVEDRIIFNFSHDIKDTLGLPGFPLLCLFSRSGGIWDFRHIASLFCGGKAEHKNVVALFDGRGGEFGSIFGLFSVAFASLTGFLTEVVKKVVNVLRCDSAHDAVPEIGQDMVLQVPGVAVVSVRRKTLLPGIKRKEPLDKLCIGAARIVLRLDRRLTIGIRRSVINCLCGATLFLVLCHREPDIILVLVFLEEIYIGLALDRLQLCVI